MRKLSSLRKGGGEGALLAAKLQESYLKLPRGPPRCNVSLHNFWEICPDVEPPYLKSQP
jgi:hypothetical protein